MIRSLFAVALVLVAGSTLIAADAVKSGPQVGQKVPGPFHPLNVNGEFANEKHCLFCEYGEAPVAMIFAREATPAVVKLAQKLDAAAAKAKEMGACMIFCSDSADLAKTLKDTATKANLKKVVLAVDNPAGPKGYEVAKDAEVTVLLYVDRKVVGNLSFKKGEFDEKAVETVVAALSKLQPKN